MYYKIKFFAFSLFYLFLLLVFSKSLKAAYYWYYTIHGPGGSEMTINGCTSGTGTAQPCDVEDPVVKEYECGQLDVTCSDLFEYVSSSGQVLPGYISGGGVLNKVTTIFDTTPIYLPQRNVFISVYGNYTSIAENGATIHRKIFPISSLNGWVSDPLYGMGLIGFSDRFLTFTDQYLFGTMGSVDTCCNTNHRSYTYIYIPRGWWDFGISVNQSSDVPTMFPDPPFIGAVPGYTPNQSNFPCVYTNRRGACFPSDDILPTYMGGVYCLKCGGELYGWIGATGTGSSVSDPLRSDVRSSIYDPNKSMEELFALYNWSEFTRPYNGWLIGNTAQGVPYSYSWVTPPSPANPDSGNEMQDAMYTCRPHEPCWTYLNGISEVNIRLNNDYYLQTLFFSFANFISSGASFLPERIEVVCNDPGMSGKLLGSYSEVIVDAAGERVVMLDGSVCRNFNIKFYPTARSNTVVVGEIGVEGIPRGSSNAPKVDEIWTGPRYYDGGYYPVQFSITFDVMRRFEGQKLSYVMKGQRLLWRSYNPANGQYGPIREYIDGVDGARFYSCGSGGLSLSCSCTPKTVGSIVSGETKNITIATLESYGTPVDVTSSNGSALSVNSVSVNSSTGDVSVNVTAGEVDSVTNVTLSVSAPASDTTGEACGSESVPCSVTIAVLPGKFWQAINADVIAPQNVKSLVPEGQYLLLKPGSDSNDTPGIAFYGGNINTGQGSVSEKGWKSNTNMITSYSQYNYSYFENRVSSEVKTKWSEGQGTVSGEFAFPETPGMFTNFYNNATIEKDDYRYFKVSKNSSGVAKLTIDAPLNISLSRKLVVFVDGDVEINSNVTLVSPGSDFLMIVSSGDIKLGSGVTRLDGIYIANNSGKNFTTGTRGPRQDSQLKVNGTIIANSFNLQRSLPANQAQTTPAELFEYKPQLLLAIPHYFNPKNYNWREVNP